MKCHIGEATEAVDLNGRLMLPGSQDCHTHARLAGLYKMPWFLDVGADKVSCPDDLRKILAEAAAETPKGQWIMGALHDRQLADGTEVSDDADDCLRHLL